MSIGCYLGVGGVKEITGCYVGINGVVRKVNNIYGGINGAVKDLWQSVPVVYEYTTDTSFTVTQNMTVDFFGVGGGGGASWSGGKTIYNPNSNSQTGTWVMTQYEWDGAGGAGGECITVNKVALVVGDIIRIVIGSGGNGGSLAAGSSILAQNGGTTYVYKNGVLILTAKGGSKPYLMYGGDSLAESSDNGFNTLNRSQVIHYYNNGVNVEYYSYTGAGGRSKYTSRETTQGYPVSTNNYSGRVGDNGRKAFGDIEGAYYGGGGGGTYCLGGSGGGAGCTTTDNYTGLYASTPNSGGGGAGVYSSIYASYSKGANGIVLMRKSKS